MAKTDEKKVEIKDEFAEMRAKRRSDAEALLLAKSSEVDQREEFRKFFVKVSGQLKLDKSMESILWLHFKASGFDKSEKFDEGIKHFGY
jgi:hypothetical protein